jgi:hypothetical protein
MIASGVMHGCVFISKSAIFTPNLLLLDTAVSLVHRRRCGRSFGGRDPGSQMM